MASASLAPQIGVARSPRAKELTVRLAALVAALIAAFIAALALSAPASGGIALAAPLPAGQPAPARAVGAADTATVVARCAEAMGGLPRIEALRSLRVEVVYLDHGKPPVVHEVLRPNRFRSESAGRFVAVFDGERASYWSLDPARSGDGPKLVPASDLADFDVDIAWLVPAFFDYPAEYLGTSESGGTLCHRLGVRLPLGARMTYLVDASTGLVKVIAADVTVRGKALHTEREWRDYRTVQGIRYPGSMTYAGRDGTVQTATIESVTLNPVLDADRMRVPPGAR